MKLLKIYYLQDGKSVGTLTVGPTTSTQGWATPVAVAVRVSSPFFEFNKWTKISSLIIFELKNDGKKWSRIYFEIHRAPLEIPVKLPGQFGNSG